MKNVTFLLLFAVSFLVGKEAFAQKKLKAGSITMEMEMTFDDPATQSQIEMMGANTMEFLIQFDGKKSRTSISGMGGMMDMSTIIDMKAKKGLMLQSMMGQQMATVLDKEMIEKQFASQTDQSDDVEIIKTTETKEILGYKCQKYILKVTEGETDVAMELYVTTELEIPNSQFQAQYGGGGKIEGFPLLIVANDVENQGQTMSMRIEAQEISDEKPDADLFDLSIPEGYEEVEPGDMPASGGM